MKKKLSITVDENMINIIEELIEEGRFRNKSHVMEYSLNRFLRENKNDS